jgi:tetratricopeptide (TPR) repeat protein
MRAVNDMSSVEMRASVEPQVAVTFDEAIAVGIGRLREGRLEAAEAVYQAFLAVAPECVDALHILGVLRHQRGHFEAAIGLIRRAIMSAPRYADAHNNLGNIYKDQGELGLIAETLQPGTECASLKWERRVDRHQRWAAVMGFPHAARCCPRRYDEALAAAKGVII